MTTQVIRKVRVFDGHALSEPTTVVVDDGGILGVDLPGAEGAETIDGTGLTLLPGLIDTHVHVDRIAQLEAGAAWGITTMLDMGCRDLPGLSKSIAGRVLPTLLSAGAPASAPNSMAVRKMGFASSTTVDGPADADRFVTDRVAEGSSYVKILVEDPKIPGTKALDASTVVALVESARRAGLKTVGHVVSADTMMTALRAGIDVVTHTALTAGLGPELDQQLDDRDTVLIPTLTMMNGVVQTLSAKLMFRLLRPFVPAVRMDYAYARATVSTFRRAGATILAGTDSNADPSSPFQVPHGESLHEELERLVDAGLTPAEALRGATVLAAETFGLSDRGEIRAGRRADLLLVDGDPTSDISTTRNIRGVWIGGVRTT